VFDPDGTLPRGDQRHEPAWPLLGWRWILAAVRALPERLFVRSGL
jgi:hypothetical protein